MDSLYRPVPSVSGMRPKTFAPGLITKVLTKLPICKTQASLGSVTWGSDRDRSPADDGSNLTVYFFVRERDSRARVVCKVRHRSRSSYYCLPLNLLEVTREGSSLQLCRRRRSGTELVPWLILKFRTIESKCSRPVCTQCSADRCFRNGYVLLHVSRSPISRRTSAGGEPLRL